MPAGVEKWIDVNTNAVKSDGPYSTRRDSQEVSEIRVRERESVHERVCVRVR